MLNLLFHVISVGLAVAVAVAGCGTAESSPGGGADAAAEAGTESGPLADVASPPFSSATMPLAPGTVTGAPGTTTEGRANESSTSTSSTTTTLASATPTGAPVTTAPASGPATAPIAPPTTAPAPPPTTAPAPPPTTAPPPPASGKPCIVSLHGKGGGGQGEWTGSDGVRHSFPAGNDAAWGGLHWLYYPESNYQTTRNIVANDITAGGCGRVIVYGFSNGAAFAAKLYCRGETFGGAVVGYVIDDPVVDHAVEGCARPPVNVVLYWTGDIDVPDGWDCGDWTCEGGAAIGIARYEAAIGVGRTPSVHSTHRQYVDPPEFHSWF